MDIQMGLLALAFTTIALGAAVLRILGQNRRLATAEAASRESTQRLQASEARLYALFDASPDAWLISDEQGVICQANPQVESLLGYRVAELLGQPVEILVPERLRAGHPALRKRFAATPGARLMGRGREIKALRKDGSECDVEISLSQITTDQGVFVASALRDISERKQAEDSLRQSEEKLRSLYELSPLGIALTDIKGRHIEFNAAFMRITGYTEEELKALDFRALAPRKYDALEREQLASLSSTGHYGPYETEYLRKDGSLIPLQLNGALVAGRGGENYVWSIVEDISERKRAKEKIEELAFFDQLTGLPNRALLLDRLRQAMTTGSRNGNYGALLLIDLDNFKTLNDTLGHDVGDLLLQQVGQRLSQCVRAEDSVGRLGGDEFVVILTGLSPLKTDAATQAEAIGQKILATLNLTYPLGEMVCHSTPSIGATLFRGHQCPIDELLQQADLAMYGCKETGRNAMRFFDPAMQTAVLERAALEADMRGAIAAGQFLLHYQPQVVGDGQVIGAEALVRWQHPERGLVSPAEFIPLAESTGLILPLGQWVLETACRQVAAWAACPDMAELTVAVNVSAHQFRQPDFVDQVLAVLASTGANPEQVKLELTESLLVDNVQDIIEKMFALKAKGLGFSMDDFGTGYSSLSYLKRLPLDQLKIDQSFVRDVLSDPNDAAIARTVVALAHSLGLGVIAEGVETAAQRDFLASSGCHAYQGYLFSRPLTAEAFEAFIRRA